MLATLILLASTAFAKGVRLEEVIVTEIPKPEIAIVLTKQNLTPKYDLQLKQSFLPKVVASVEKKPF